MSLAAGTKLGPYEIVAPLGAGGMGEVYRGRDPRLARAVAVKVLPENIATDADRVSRFQQEARAAGALNHPNILVVYDVGTHGSNPYLVTELLEGETLRQQLDRGALPVRKALDYGVQIAKGLSAAHGKGIVHRDLKPENLFVTRGGHVKILDFGLAKLSPQRDAEPDRTQSVQTDPGSVLGTAAYMSPEQVRGLETDPRSDIFSFGAILYEMLSGCRAFQRKTAADTMSAILKEEPPELVASGAIDRIVRRSLEKNRPDRFQSAQDLGFALEAVAGSSASTPRIEIGPGTGMSKRKVWAAIAALILMGATFILGHYTGSSGKVSAPYYQALTFRRGLIHSARFAPDGRTIVYSAAWNGDQSRVFVTRLDSPESRPLDQVNVNLLGVSSTGEVAISVGCTSVLMPMLDCGGTLARMSLSGGAPRELSSDIRAADWSPDGKSLAVVRQVRSGSQVEYPIGTVLAQSAGWINSVRISPTGDAIAYADHPTFGDDGGSIKVIDTKGHPMSFSGAAGSLEGFAWTPDGKELWFVGNPQGGWANSILALSLSGKQRFLLRLPGIARLHDISSDGRLLLTTETFGLELFVHRPGDQRDKDLSWLAGSCVSDISENGHTLSFWDGTDSATSDIGFDTYVRDIDGAAPVRLGPGYLGVFSPKSDWVLAVLPPSHNLEVLPTGAGDARVIDGYGIQNHVAMAWLPDGRTISFAGNETGRGWRIYLQDVGGGQPRAITPEILQPNTYDGPTASPDGALAWARDTSGTGWLYPIKGGASIRLRNLLPEDQWIRWTADSQGAYVFNTNGLPARVYRINFRTDQRTQMFAVMPSDGAGVSVISAVRTTPDGTSYAYSYIRLLSKLFVVTGVK